MILELCESVQTSKLSSQGPRSLNSWFHIDRKANGATTLSNGVASSFRAETSLPDLRSLKKQSKLYHMVNPALYVL